MSKPIVYVARRIPDEGLKLLQSHCDIRLHEGELPPTRDELLAGVAGCSGILSLLSDRIDEEVFSAAGPSLRVVSNFAVGYNNIDVELARTKNIHVGNTPDVLTEATADIAVALLLGVARRIVESQQDVRDGNWKTWEPMGWIGADLVGRTVGIVGMGRIGQAVAKRLAGGWNMKVLYTARSPRPEVDRQWGAAQVDLPELLQNSDVVSLHVPLSETTRNLIGESELRQMKENAILINTARGEVIDQRALVSALQDQEIWGAGLDVCTPEPIATDHPLVKHPRCLLLPHIGSATKDSRGAMATRAAENILAGLDGGPLPYPVR